MFFCRCLCLQKQNHVACINKSRIAIIAIYSSLYFFSRYFLSSLPSVKTLLTIPIVPDSNKIEVIVAR